MLKLPKQNENAEITDACYRDYSDVIQFIRALSLVPIQGVTQKILKDIQNRIIADLIHRQESDTPLSEIASIFYYSTKGKNGDILVFQLYLSKTSNPQKQTKSFARTTVNAFSRSSAQPPYQKVILEKIASFKNNDFEQFRQSIISKELFHLVPLDKKNNISSKEKDKVREILLSNYDRIVEETEKYQTWHLPTDVIEQLSSYITQDYLISSTEIVNPKELQKCSRDMIKKFVQLKIEELIGFFTSPNNFKQPGSEIFLSILTQTKEQVIIEEAKLIINKEGLAIIPTFLNKTIKTNVLDCIFESSWLSTPRDRTVLRFADQALETSLEIKYYCSDIPYGIVSENLSKRSGVELNFWENLAGVLKAKDKPIPDEMVAGKVQESLLELKQLESRKSKIIQIAENIKMFSLKNPETPQLPYVEDVLSHQRMGVGTLLYLPTGYGKTFIMLMAMMQHYSELSLRKPYLIIAPSNVQEVWRKNLAIINEKRETHLTIAHYDDGKKFADKVAQLQSDLIPNPSGNNNDFALMITTKLLDSYVKKNCLNSTSNIFSDLNLEENKFVELFQIKGKKEITSPSDTVKQVETTPLTNARLARTQAPKRQRTSVKNSGNSQIYFIIGDKDFWHTKYNILMSFPFKDILEILTSHKIKRKDEFSDPAFYFPKRSRRYDDISQELDIEQFTKNKKQFEKELTKNQREFDNIDSLRSWMNKNGMELKLKEELFQLVGIYLSFGTSKKKSGKFSTLISKLEIIKTTQDERILILRSMKDTFAGIILDESERQFSSYSDSICNNFIFDIANAFVAKSVPNSKDNPLILAATATPWRNKMEEFVLHMQFLLPTFMGRYLQLKNKLLNYWDALENALSDVKEDQLEQRLTPIFDFYHPWVGSILDLTIGGRTLETSEKSVNKINGNLVLIQCKNEFSFNTSKTKSGSDGQLTRISGFYSHCLDVNNDKPLQDRNSTILQKIQNTFETTDVSHTKYAFYIDKHDAAEGLANFIYTQETFQKNNLLVGFYYDESFEKRSWDFNNKNGRKYTNRRMDLNAFNNIFDFNDYLEYRTWNFSSKIKKLSDAAVKKFTQALKDPNFRKKLGDNFDNFFSALIHLEANSKKTIIRDLPNEIKTFYKALRPSGKSKKIPSLDEYLDNFEKKFKKGSEFDIKDFVANTLLFYLNHITQTNVIIFGIAASSGISIDADYLYMLSGAWTEGQLNQVRGRVGRPRPDGTTRTCTVYMPLTNTMFELFILKYYISKALYNEFLTNKAINISNLCMPLYIAKKVYQLFKASLPNDQLPLLDDEMMVVDDTIPKLMQKRARSFTNDLIHDVIHRKWQDRPYIEATPYQKGRMLIAVLNYPELQIEIEKFERYLILLDTKRVEKAILPSVDEPILEDHNPPAPELLQEDPAPKISIADRVTTPQQDDIVFIPQPTVVKVSANTDPALPKVPMPNQAVLSTIPFIISRLEYSFDYTNGNHKNSLESFIKKNQTNKFIILSLPTRNGKTDLTWDVFGQALSESIHDFPVCILVIYGVNSEATDPESVVRHQSMPPYGLSTNKVFFMSHQFQWQEKDRKPKKENNNKNPKKPPPPLGQMRNYCLSKAKALFDILCGDYLLQQKDIFYISMDGDTKLTARSFKYIFEKANQPGKNVFVTGGYELFDEDKLLENKKKKRLWNMFDILNTDESFTKIASQLSLNVYARCALSNIDYYGYFAEPLICVSSQMTALLFSEELNYKNYKRDHFAPYGFWDSEGRRFSHFLTDLAKRHNQSYLIIGPSDKPEERPFLTYYDKTRFDIQWIFSENPVRELRYPFSKGEMSTIIARMYTQSQNSVNFYFMGANISTALRLDMPSLGIVRKFASYFYLRWLLDLLGLGPLRSYQFFLGLKEKVQNNTDDFKLESILCQHSKNFFGINIKEVLTFIKKHFIDGFKICDPNNRFASNPNAEKIKTINLMFIEWALQWSQQLSIALGWYYQGEHINEDEDVYISMSTPDDYPQRVIELSYQEHNDSDSDEDPDVDVDDQIQEMPILKAINKADYIDKLFKHLKDFYRGRKVTDEDLMPMDTKYHLSFRAEVELAIWSGENFIENKALLYKQYVIEELSPNVRFVSIFVEQISEYKLNIAIIDYSSGTELKNIYIEHTEDEYNFEMLVETLALPKPRNSINNAESLSRYGLFSVPKNSLPPSATANPVVTARLASEVGLENSEAKRQQLDVPDNTSPSAMHL